MARFRELHLKPPTPERVDRLVYSAIANHEDALCARVMDLSGPVGYKTPRILDHFGFAILLFSFGYVALRLVFANEQRLLSIENELAIAREIQRSILPRSVPKLNHIRISAARLKLGAEVGRDGRTSTAIGGLQTKTCVIHVSDRAGVARQLRNRYRLHRNHNTFDPSSPPLHILERPPHSPCVPQCVAKHRQSRLSPPPEIQPADLFSRNEQAPPQLVVGAQKFSDVGHRCMWDFRG